MVFLKNGSIVAFVKRHYRFWSHKAIQWPLSNATICTFYFSFLKKKKNWYRFFFFLLELEEKDL